MKNLIKWSIRESKVTILVSLVILIFGGLSYYFMPRQENPDTTSPVVRIITIFPGASAETVREQVTKKIEDEVAKLDRVDVLKSYSQDNASTVFAILNDEVDYDKEWSKLKTSLEKLQKKLPSTVQAIDMETELTKTAGIIISLSSDEYDNVRLTQFAKDYRQKLARLEGINSVEINGSKTNRVKIEINKEKINSLQLSIDDVFNLIRAQNVVIPAGSVSTDEGKINVSVPATFDTLDDFKNLVINVSRKNGELLKLSDIAEIGIEEVKSDNYFIKAGRPSVLVTAYFEEDENVVLIGQKVRKEIEKLKNVYPKDLIIDEVLFLPEDVAKSVDSFILNLLEGILFVVLVIFFGMGIRNAVLVSVAIPLSIAMTFSSMGLIDVELQQVSISALIIALGILVDNAIVIIDAIQHHINDGLSRVEASFKGAKEQALPVLTSTLTTIAAFSPLMALPGAAGEFTRSLPLIVIVALTASYIVAMLVTPSLASLFLKERTKKRDMLKPVQKFYSGLMEYNLKNPILSLFIVLALLGGAVFAGVKLIDVKMFPYVDKNWFYVNIKNEVVGDINDTEKLVLKAEEILSSYPEVTETTDAVGGGLPRYYMMADYMMPSEDNGMILAKFDLSKSGRFEKREDLVYDIQKRFDKEFVGGYGTAKLLEINIPGPNVEVRVAGDSYAEIEKVTDRIYKHLLNDKRTINVQQNKPSYRYRYKVDINDEKALRYGLNKYDIQKQLNMSLHGMVAGVYTKAGKNYDIFVKSNVKTISDIENIRIKSSFTKNKYLLKEIADISLEKELGAIFRFDRKTVVMVTSDIRPGYGVSSVTDDVYRLINDMKKEENSDVDNVDISFGGDEETMSLYLKGLYKAAFLAIVLIYLILLVQFNSLLQPLIIMMTVPLSLIGIIVALIVTGTNFTFTVGLGAASLMGIVVNNGILLIEYINRARKDGMSIKDACRHSVDKRIRPILLSSVTTIFGLIPLAFSDSTFFTPMSIALMGGLIAATFMTITVVPTIYYVLEKRTENDKGDK